MNGVNVMRHELFIKHDVWYCPTCGRTFTNHYSWGRPDTICQCEGRESFYTQMIKLTHVYFVHPECNN